MERAASLMIGVSDICRRQTKATCNLTRASDLQCISKGYVTSEFDSHYALHPLSQDSQAVTLVVM